MLRAKIGGAALLVMVCAAWPTAQGGAPANQPERAGATSRGQ